MTSVLDKYLSGEAFEAEILESIDFQSFRQHSKLMPLPLRHRAQFIEEVKRKNLLKENPAIVRQHAGDDFYTVYLGYGWIEAACELKLPFYYIVSTQIEIEDIAHLEQVKFKWKLKDYLAFWKGMNKRSYSILSAYIEKYQLPLSITIRLCTNEKLHLKYFKSGEYKANTIDSASTTAIFLKDYIDMKFAGALTNNFAQAIQKLVVDEQYTHEKSITYFKKHHQNIREKTMSNYIELLKKISGFQSNYNL